MHLFTLFRFNLMSEYLQILIIINMSKGFKSGLRIILLSNKYNFIPLMILKIVLACGQGLQK